MKYVTKGAFLFILICLASSFVAAQIPNAGFESWSGGNPVNWSTLNFLFHNISQSSTAHTGSSSLKAEIVSYNNTPASISLQTGASAEGFAISSKVTTLTGYYQFNPVSGDRMVVNVVLYHGGSYTSTVVATSLATPITGTVSSWTQFSIPLYYTKTDAPDWAEINFTILGPTSTDIHVGTYFLVDDLAFTEGATGVKESATGAPAVFKLNDNYPNPFNPSTSINFSLPERSYVTLEVMNVLGQRVALLEQGELERGEYQRTWAGNAASGVYFYRMQAVGVNDPASHFSETKRMMLAR